MSVADKRQAGLTDEWAPYRVRLSALLRDGPRDLDCNDLAHVLPPRGPRGADQNSFRGLVIRELNRAGFTHARRRLK